MGVNKTKEKLIDLFAANTIKEIEENNGERLKQAFEISDFHQLLEDNEFNSYYEILKTFRYKLDTIARETEGIEQVKDCLRWISEEKDEKNLENVEIISRLIRKRFCQEEWNQSEKKYFDDGIEMLEKWKDFFLSYTNQNSTETNSDFEDILDHVFKSDFQDNREKTNYLARLIAHYLVKFEGLTAFYDKDNITCGDKIKEKILKHCTSVYAFVQLVEQPIFSYSNNQKNWCFEEFKKFDQWLAKSGQTQDNRYYFFLTESIDRVFPANFPGIYKNWRNKIEERHVEDLSQLGNNREIRSKVKIVAKKIVETKKQILDSYMD
ncbi:MAG: hypothetical protein GTO45_03295 [Candidatus Aminicenantes bacterium]|nr:hypothetical protein [Candidatus Aminicenantes bacterium]NIM77752.1 hypothetical protein [Candidatus Aminicenantes bacterium]NIN17065.1 hypothetical protein [Candidatus Aminicenantes bacterium]NIN40958.1 hypothetical protein [Candidatus Aminicenantes bacterium]NIN83763.1 hypothetical protein [Candidatus Aminicenantes bacterium]